MGHLPSALELLTPPGRCQSHFTDGETEAPGHGFTSWTKAALRGGKGWQGALSLSAPTPHSSSIIAGKEGVAVCKDSKPQRWAGGHWD